MLLYQSNIKEIVSTYKRAKGVSLAGEISMDHPLYVLWCNIKMFLDAADKCDVDLDLLGYFGKKVDEYSKNHMLKDDPSIRAMLHEWLAYASRLADFSLWQDDPPKPEPTPEKIVIDNGSWLEGLNINGLSAGATAISCCGFLHQVSTVSAGIERGHINGEYGEKLNKAQQKEMLVWALTRTAQLSPYSCWRTI